MSMTICPDCDGDGQSFMHVHTADRYTPCFTCKGRGKIHERYYTERIEMMRETPPTIPARRAYWLARYDSFRAAEIDDIMINIPDGSSIPQPGSTKRRIYGPCRVRLTRAQPSGAVTCEVLS